MPNEAAREPRAKRSLLRPLPLWDPRRGEGTVTRVALAVRQLLHASIIAALEPEGENRACALGDVFARQIMIAVALEPRIAHPCDLRVFDKPVSDDERIVAVALHAQRQRLNAGQDEKGVERRER